LSDAANQFVKLRRIFQRLYCIALERRPDAIICVDYSGFNRRFAHAIKKYVRSRRDWFHDWNPKIIQYVSPQVWASREGRAYQMAKDYDLLLSIFPFEKEWYAKRVPDLRVEFVGHPLFDRYPARRQLIASTDVSGSACGCPGVVLLRGSQTSERARHLAFLLGSWDKIRRELPAARGRMVLPNDSLLQQARARGLPSGLDCRAGGMSEALREADL